MGLPTWQALPSQDKRRWNSGPDSILAYALTRAALGHGEGPMAIAAQPAAGNRCGCRRHSISLPEAAGHTTLLALVAGSVQELPFDCYSCTVVLI